MSDTKDFLNGAFFKQPHPNAPFFVLGQLGINWPELIKWYNDNASDQEWSNFDIKISKKGNPYFVKQQPKEQDIPEPKKEKEAPESTQKKKAPW